MRVLLEVWREVGRNAPIEEAVERIARLVAEELPVKALLIRRLEVERQRLDTVAVGVVGRGRVPEVTRTELTVGEVEALVAWGRGGGVLRGRESGLVSVVVPPEVEGEPLVGALREGERVIGFGVALGSGRGFRVGDEEKWAALLEPLSAALRIDLQRTELVRYREALEADKQALLSRLERQEITEAIVGADGGLREVMEQVVQVARTDVPVLLLGETGTGKEVIAREIHRLSPRAKGPVVRVNCGAIPAGLIDSELFGHERGSFTGAVSDRAGWFERADGGTLFLDEIGELPADAQVRLLRVLQDGTFERVGGRRTYRVDVRIVAATHRDLEAMVREGTFREDLWYRISVFPIRLPPLRERPGDIPALAEHFAWRAGKRLGGVPLAPTPEDVELLLQYSWPGNVRELAAVIERAVILGGGRRLEIAAALGGAFVGRAKAPAKAERAERERFLTLDEAMTRHIEAALRATGGRIEGPSGAAALLGINPHTLRARMRKLGIDWRRFRRPREKAARASA
ncbi:MAG TPA: sigma-54 dependent transcriptional regulator [Longimicrobiales bacterium]